MHPCALDESSLSIGRVKNGLQVQIGLALPSQQVDLVGKHIASVSPLFNFPYSPISLICSSVSLPVFIRSVNLTPLCTHQKGPDIFITSFDPALPFYCVRSVPSQSGWVQPNDQSCPNVITEHQRDYFNKLLTQK